MPENIVKIRNTLSIAVPEGFQPMSPEELRSLYRNDDPDRWGAWDKDRHVILTVSWKQYPALLSALADIRAVARRNRQLTEKEYAGHDYRPGGFFSLQTGAVRLEGYRFSYRLDSMVQCAETVLMKHQKTVYSITCVGREENAEEDSRTFRGILESLRTI